MTFLLIYFTKLDKVYRLDWITLSWHWNQCQENKGKRGFGSIHLNEFECNCKKLKSKDGIMLDCLEGLKYEYEKFQIINENTGEIIEEAKFTGEYQVIYTNIDDMGRLKHIRELDNAKFGDRHWIKNFVYMPIHKKLIEKFDELTPINPLRILFLEDMKYEKPTGSKNQQQAKISKANKQFSAMTGYDYILETRNYFIERMNREQTIALIYHKLRHIDMSGEL